MLSFNQIIIYLILIFLINIIKVTNENTSENL